MLTKYSFKNYKAFTEGEIQLKPITILLGSNSSGKTSLAQILLLMQQTVNATTQKYNAALKLHGKYVSMGEVENLFKDKDLRNSLVLEFEFQSLHLYNLMKRGILNDFLYSLYEIYRRYYELSADFSNKGELSKFRKELETVRKSLNVEDVIEIEEVADSLIKNISDLEKITKYKSIKEIEFYEKFLFRQTRDLRHMKTYASINDLSTTLKLLSGIKKITSKKFTISYELKYNKAENRLQITSFRLINKNRLVLGLKFDIQKNSLDLINSDFIEESYLNNYNSTLHKFIDLQQSIIYLFKERINESKYQFVTKILRILNIANNELTNNFNEDKLFHISPLRAEPKRFYFLDKANIDPLAGDNIVELLKEDDELLAKVNDWLKIFNVKLGITEFKDIIHRLTVTQGGLELDLDITDVGFGISQILPVVVQGFLLKGKSLTIIEQPEIHLHPKMQSELADLFIDIVKVKEYNKHLIIETHSEYLLKRLRLRIAEGVIPSEEVAIYFLESRTEDKEANIKEIKIHKNGSFKWPEEFYANDLNDTLQFLSHQLKDK